MHEKFSGIKYIMVKARKFYICKGCRDQPACIVRTGVDINDDRSLEFIDKLCYLGDMLSAVRDGLSEWLPLLLLLEVFSISYTESCQKRNVFLHTAADYCSVLTSTAVTVLPM